MPLNPPPRLMLSTAGVMQESTALAPVPSFSELLVLPGAAINAAGITVQRQHEEFLRSSTFPSL